MKVESRILTGVLIMILLAMNMLEIGESSASFTDIEIAYNNIFDACFSGCGTCGNSVVEFGEQCDDGNTANGDGCSSVCLLE